VWIVPRLPVTEAVVTTSTITITAPAVTGERVFLISASMSTDLAGALDLKGGADGTTSVYTIKTIANTTTIINPSFVPPLPLPISLAGQAASFVLNVTTTGKLSVCYGYGL